MRFRSKLQVTIGLLTVLGIVTPSAAFAASDDTHPSPALCMALSSGRTYTPAGIAWYRYDSGSVVNNSAATVTKSFTHTFSASLTTTVSAEVGVEATVAVAEINSKLGISVAVTASVSRSTTFSVSVPPYKAVTYRDGLAKRFFNVTIHNVSGCHEWDIYGKVFAANNYTSITNG